MIAAAFLSLLLQASAPAASEPATAGQQAVRQHPLTLFNFFRARYFHDRAAAGDCLRLEPERTRYLNARYETARSRLAALVGPGVVDQPEPASAAHAAARPCDGGLLFGYEDKVVMLERNLTGGAP